MPDDSSAQYSQLRDRQLKVRIAIADAKAKLTWLGSGDGDFLNQIQSHYAYQELINELQAELQTIDIAIETGAANAKKKARKVRGKTGAIPLSATSLAWLKKELKKQKATHSHFATRCGIKYETAVKLLEGQNVYSATIQKVRSEFPLMP